MRIAQSEFECEENYVIEKDRNSCQIIKFFRWASCLCRIWRCVVQKSAVKIFLLRKSQISVYEPVSIIWLNNVSIDTVNHQNSKVIICNNNNRKKKLRLQPNDSRVRECTAHAQTYIYMLVYWGNHAAAHIKSDHIN